MGKTIFISSHILSELAELCDSVTIIDRGSIKFSGAMDDLLERGRTEAVYLLTLGGPADELLVTLAALSSVASAEQVAEGRSQIRVALQPESSSNQLLEEMLRAGITVNAMIPERKHLNQAFMDLTQGGVV
jgi:ABC-2 type transport system ATP-binding protein